MIQVTNSLSGKKEAFVPQVPGKVRMYVCGPTVYNFIHIGNARPLVFFDVVARYLRFAGFEVTRVMNYTDVDDKIIQKAHQEGSRSEVVSEKYIQEFQTDMHLLQIEPPTHQPKVTDHIPEIISLIETLIQKGHAYVSEDGEVFYSVRSFQEYGKLSKKRVDDLLVGARVAPDEKKKDPLDFSLWKPQKAPNEPAWKSPWGLGRPGWHIECSAMAIKYLGNSFDIHGGGMDLMHPHHENEIAQSEGATSTPFAKYWLHNNMLTFQSEKMSKSLGNIWLTRDFIEKYSAELLKFFLISGHYRSTLDFSEGQIRDHQSALQRVYKTLDKANRLIVLSPSPAGARNAEFQAALKFSETFNTKWQEAMNDDFNTAKVLGFVFEYVKLINSFVDKKGFVLNDDGRTLLETFLNQMSQLAGVLNVFGQPTDAFLNQMKSLFLKSQGLLEADILKLIEDRIEARKNKDFKRADTIRDELLQKGIELMDKGAQTEWEAKFTG